MIFPHFLRRSSVWGSARVSASTSACSVMLSRESRCTHLRGRLWHTFPAPAELLLRQASVYLISCTLLRFLMPAVTVFRDCITISLDGELPAAVPSKYGDILSSMLKPISCASSLSAVPCRDRSALLTQNFLHEFCFELWADHVGPRLECDRDPVLPCLRWRQSLQIRSELSRA